MIELVEGSSIDPAIVERVRGAIRPGEKVMVVLDSAHHFEHVRRELEMYHTMVTPGSYIVATDGLMTDVFDTPRGTVSWKADNPKEAALDFLRRIPSSRSQSRPGSSTRAL